MKLAVVFGFALGLTLTACTKPIGDSLEITGPKTGVYNGQLTPADNPISHTTVLLYFETADSVSKCTGSVLSPTVILTAAHCVTQTDAATKMTKVINPNEIMILNPLDLNTDTNFAVGTKILVHPNYLAQSNGPTYTFFSNGYDLALIQLSEPLPASYKPVVLSDRLEALTENQVFVAGFGRIALDPNAPTNYTLYHGPVTIDLSLNTVKQEFSGVEIPYYTTNLNTSPNLSFKKNTLDASICHGDSGGPLYFVKDGEVFLAGVNVSMISSNPGNSCSTENDGTTETSVSLAGPAMGFVLDSFNQLTGQSLPLVRDVPEKDPKTFEFYLQAPVLNSKNNIANLEGYEVVKDGRDGLLALIDQVTAATICQSSDVKLNLPAVFIKFESTFESQFDGKTILPVLLSHEGVFDGFVEGRAKLEGNTVKMVVLTSEGYLSAEMPYKVCNFPAL